MFLFSSISNHPAETKKDFMKAFVKHNHYCRFGGDTIIVSLLSGCRCLLTWICFPLLPFLLGFFCCRLLLVGVWVWALGGISWLLLSWRLAIWFWGCWFGAAHCSVFCIWVSFLSEAVVGLVGCNEVLCYLEKQSKLLNMNKESYWDQF